MGGSADFWNLFFFSVFFWCLLFGLKFRSFHVSKKHRSVMFYRPWPVWSAVAKDIAAGVRGGGGEFAKPPKVREVSRKSRYTWWVFKLFNWSFVCVCVFLTFWTSFRFLLFSCWFSLRGDSILQQPALPSHCLQPRWGTWNLISHRCSLGLAQTSQHEPDMLFSSYIYSAN